MKLYKALVRINGSLLNEVAKDNLTAAEIMVLQRIHGDDAVQNVIETGAVKGRSGAQERERLAGIYRAGGPDIDRKNRVEGKRFIENIFGVAGVPLPEEYTAAKQLEEGEEPAEEEIILKGAAPKLALGEVIEPAARRRKPPDSETAAADLMA